jgi:hypothetical protein
MKAYGGRPFNQISSHWNGSEMIGNMRRDLWSACHVLLSPLIQDITASLDIDMLPLLAYCPSQSIFVAQVKKLREMICVQTSLYKNLL